MPVRGVPADYRRGAGSSVMTLAYARAESVADVVANLDPDTAIIAGGTEMLNWIRLGIAAPARLLDVQAVHIGPVVRREDGHLHVSALATLAQVGAHPDVLMDAAALAQACHSAASPQVRHRATLGGNVLQKTRCPYFRAEEPLPWACNKRQPASGCAARHGHTADAAVFGWTDACVATQPSDPAVALACLDAAVDISGPGGVRSVPMTDFFVVPADGQDARVENVLGVGEMITGFRVPVGPPGTHSAYVKIRERASYAYALASAAARVTPTGDVAIALGSVAQRPWRLPGAESALRGLTLSADNVAAAILAATADARPLADNAHKLTIARTAAARAVLAAAGGAA